MIPFDEPFPAIRLTARGGEREAVTIQDEVGQAFEEMREAVYRYLLTLGLYPPQAQETTQEVFLRLYVARKKGDEIQNTRAWVFRVAHNLGHSVREREGNARLFDPELELEVADQGKNPEEKLLERERLLRVHRALQGLSERQRHCLDLRAEGLRYHEIAAVLGIGTPTVGEFLRRALARLKKVAHD